MNSEEGVLFKQGRRSDSGDEWVSTKCLVDLDQLTFGSMSSYDERGGRRDKHRNRGTTRMPNLVDTSLNVLQTAVLFLAREWRSLAA
jgi:hypothetical protein